MASALNNLTIETVRTQAEAAEQLEAVLEMEVEETGEDKEEDNGTQRALGAIDFLTQDTEPIGTTLVDACNGFNKLIRFAMMWTMRHQWLEGARFSFNCDRNWAQLLIRQPGEPPVRILSIEGVTQ